MTLACLFKDTEIASRALGSSILGKGGMRMRISALNPDNLTKEHEAAHDLIKKHKRNSRHRDRCHESIRAIPPASYLDYA